MHLLLSLLLRRCSTPCPLPSCCPPHVVGTNARQALTKQLEAAQEQFKGFERADAKCQIELKNLGQKLAKATKKLEADSASITVRTGVRRNGVVVVRLPDSMSAASLPCVTCCPVTGCTPTLPASLVHLRTAAATASTPPVVLTAPPHPAPPRLTTARCRTARTHANLSNPKPSV